MCFSLVRVNETCVEGPTLCCALLAALGHMNISKGEEALYVDKQFDHFLKAVMVVIRGSERRT